MIQHPVFAFEPSPPFSLPQFFQRTGILNPPDQSTLAPPVSLTVDMCKNNESGCEVLSIPIDDEYKVSPEAVSRFADSLLVGDGQDSDTNGTARESRERKGKRPLKGVILSSPSNPTGAMMTPEEIKDMAKVSDILTSGQRVKRRHEWFPNRDDVSPCMHSFGKGGGVFVQSSLLPSGLHLKGNAPTYVQELLQNHEKHDVVMRCIHTERSPPVLSSSYYKCVLGCILLFWRYFAFPPPSCAHASFSIGL